MNSLNQSQNQSFVNANGNFTEQNRAMLQSLMHMDKELLDLYNFLRTIKPKDYNMFPKGDKNGHVTASEYCAWRRVFLIQLASDGKMNTVLEHNYIPPHKQCIVPQAHDPAFGGHDVIFHHAQRVVSSMERNYSTTIDNLALILMYVLQHCQLAQQFLNQDQIDPVQLFHDLDTLFIQQTKYTEADHIKKFWTLEIQENEMFSVFLARMEATRAELRDRFNHIITDANFQNVMQQSITGPEMFSVYEPLLDKRASLAEIKQRLIATDLHVRRRQNKVSLTNFIEQNFDRQHNRHGSPQRQINEYSRDHKERSGTPSRYRSESPKPDDQGRSSRFDRYRDRSRSTSPYASDRGYLDRNHSDKFTKPTFTKSSLRYQQASRDKSPQHPENRGRDDKYRGRDYKRARSPSPEEGDGHYSRKTSAPRHVNFKMQAAQSVTDSNQEETLCDDEWDGVDPDLRVKVEDRDRAIATWNNRSVDNASMAEDNERPDGLSMIRTKYTIN
jgi:hypothetical protein